MELLVILSQRRGRSMRSLPIIVYISQWARCLIVVGAALGIGTMPARAERNVHVGMRGLLRSPMSQVRLGTKVIATGASHRVYRVEHVQGNWIWVHGGHVQGWVESD